jgi:hypothetical protein
MKKLLITIAVLGLSFIESKSQIKSIPDFTLSAPTRNNENTSIQLN